MIGSGERFENNAVSVTNADGRWICEKKSTRFQKYSGSCDVAKSHLIILRYVMS